MVWKSICFIIKSINVVIDGKKYNYTMSATDEAHAVNGYYSFANFVKKSTNNWVTVDTPAPIYLNKISRLSIFSDAGARTPWVDIPDFLKAISDNGYSFNFKWGDYDSIFVVYPWDLQFDIDLFQLKALGTYDINESFASTYASMPSLIKPGVWDLQVEEGAAFTHEWLHGVCAFYEQYDFPIPKGQSHQNPALNYKSDPSTGWNGFYKDLLTGNVRNQGARPPELFEGGITKAMWDLGKPTNPGKMIGYGSKNQKDFIGIYKGGQSGVPDPYTIDKTRKVIRKGDGELQMMRSPKGVFALMKGDNRKCYEVPYGYWNKYDNSGGWNVLGYPIREVHSWGSGNIQDFETSGGWHSGIMNPTGTQNYYLVKGLIWKAYIATEGNGATSYLGYPTGDEHIWTNPDNGEKFNVQFFQNGKWCWAQTKSPWKYGNDKQWGKRSNP